MKIFITEAAGGLQIMARGESDDGSTVGQMSHLITEGDTFLGWTYDEIAELGEGEQDLEDKSQMIAEIVGGNMDEDSLSELIDSLDEEE